ncbi:hypothetical protein D3C87_324430 [compost metagenome]
MATIYEIHINGVFQEAWEDYQDAFNRCLNLDIDLDEAEVSIVPKKFEDNLEAGAEIHAGDFGYQEIPIEDYKPNPEWVARLSL